MIVSRIKRGALKDYDLGGRSIPSGILLPKNIELIWNQTKWEVYKCEKSVTKVEDVLIWQMSLPFVELTSSAVTNYLQKHDSSEGGALDAKRRQEDWKRLFARTIELSNKRKDALYDNAMYEIGNMSHWLGRYDEGLRQCVVPINVGIHKGKRVWAYKKDRRLIS